MPGAGRCVRAPVTRIMDPRPSAGARCLGAPGPALVGLPPDTALTGLAPLVGLPPATALTGLAWPLVALAPAAPGLALALAACFAVGFLGFACPSEQYCSVWSHRTIHG